MDHHQPVDSAIGRRTCFALFLAPFIGVGLIAACRFAGAEFWRQIADEDGPVEWLQFVGFVASSLFCLAIVWRLALHRRLVAASLYLLLALCLVFVAGEEIAWGQRLIGFATPDRLAQVNEKGEVSLHNVKSVSDSFNVGKFIVGLVVPWFLSS